MMPLGWSIPVPILNWIRLTVLELGRLQFSIDSQLKVRIFTFSGGKGGQISNCIFITPKRTSLAGTTHNDVLSVGMCPKMRPVGVTKKLSCVKLAIFPDHPRRHRPLKFCVRGRVREVVIYLKFHENRSRGLGAVRVENRPLPLTRPMAYTTACATVQAVIHLLQCIEMFYVNTECGRSRHLSAVGIVCKVPEVHALH